MNTGGHRPIWRLLCLAVLSGTSASVVAQNISAGERKHGFCIACHGIEGRSFKAHYPILAGQPAPYVLRQLSDFKKSRRSDPNMDAVVPQLDEEDMRDLAAFFASLKPYSSQYKSDPTRAIRGKEKAKRANCVACHPGLSAPGTSESARIQGQHLAYLIKQLQDFKAGRRTNDGGVMQRIAQPMTDTDIEDLCNYFAGIRLEKRGRKSP